MLPTLQEKKKTQTNQNQEQCIRKHFEVSTRLKRKEERKFSYAVLLSPCEDFISHLFPPSPSPYNVRFYLRHDHLTSITSSLNIHALGLNRLCVTTWCKDVISNTSASIWGVFPHYPHKQKEGKSYTHSLNPVTIFNSLIGISCSEPTYYFYIHIMKHILYHQLLSKDQITWLPLQFGSKWNLCPQILGIKTAFSPAPCECWMKAIMIPHVFQARSSHMSSRLGARALTYSWFGDLKKN